MYLIAALRKLVMARLGEELYPVVKSMLDEYYIPFIERQVEQAKSPEEKERHIVRLQKWKGLYNPMLWKKFLERALKHQKYSIDPRKFDEYESELAVRIFVDRKDIYNYGDTSKLAAVSFIWSHMFMFVQHKLVDIIRYDERHNVEIPMAELPEQSYIPEDEIEYEELEQELLTYMRSKDERLHELLMLWFKINQTNSDIAISVVIEKLSKIFGVSESNIYVMFRQMKKYVVLFFKERDYHVPKNIQKLVASESNIVDRVAYAHFKMLVGKSIFWNTGIL
jgi:hypothetical protein